VSNLERPSFGDAIVRAALANIPVAGPALVEGYNVARQLDRQRIEQMAAEARRAMGDDELLALKLQEDERYLDLLVVAIEAVRRTSWEGKRITMGRLLGHALTDDADIDEDAALMSALAALEAPHFRLLAEVERHDREPESEPPTIPEPYRSALLAEGVCALPFAGGMSFSTRGMNVPHLSPFGMRLLEWVRQGDSDASASPMGRPESPPA
jgi:hypothetical protein